MKRPLALFAFTFVSALAAAWIFGLAAAFITAVSALLAAAVLLIVRLYSGRGAPKISGVFPLALFAVAAAGLYFCVFYRMIVVNPAPLYGQTVFVTGTVVEEPAQNGDRFVYVLETRQITATDGAPLDGIPQKIKIRVSHADFPECAVSDGFEGEVTLFEPMEDAKSKVYARGISLTGYISGDFSTSPARSRSLYYWAVRVRQFTRETVFRALPGDIGGLTSGLLTGDDSAISTGVSTAFMRVGLTHVLAVSGQHFAVFLGFLEFLLKRLRVPQRLSAALCLPFVVLFMGVAGFSPSILRAGLMYLCYLSAKAINRQADSLTALGAAAMSICIINPFSAVDLGFLLSATATLGMLLMSGNMYNALRRFLPERRLLRAVCGTVLASLCQTFAALVFTFPVTAVFFRYFSPVSPLANIITMYPTALILCAGMVGVLFAALPFIAFLQYPALLISGLSAKFTLAVVGWLSGFRYAAIGGNRPYLLLWTAFTLVLVATALVFRRALINTQSALEKIRLALRSPLGLHRFFALAAGLSVFALVCGSASYSAANRHVTSVTVNAAENGIAVTAARGNQAFIIGGGGGNWAAYKLNRLLFQDGVTDIEWVILPALGNTFADGAADLVGYTHPKRLMMPGEGEHYNELAALNPKKMEKTGLTGAVDIWDDVKVELSDNYLSLRIDRTVIIIAYPSAGEIAERADLLITNPALPENTPNIPLAVVSASQESEALAVKRLAERGVTAWSTGDKGAVTAKTRGKGDILLTVQ